MKQLTPNLAVKDIRETINYYAKNFNFKLVMAVSEDKSSMGDTLEENTQYIWANMINEEISFMFQREDSLKEDVGDFFNTLGSSSTYYIGLDDVDELYDRVKEEVDVIKHIEDTWYGQREFYVRDLNGYILAFASTQKES